jgi:hypothetical protein
VVPLTTPSPVEGAAKVTAWRSAASPAVEAASSASSVIDPIGFASSASWSAPGPSGGRRWVFPSVSCATMAVKLAVVPSA